MPSATTAAAASRHATGTDGAIGAAFEGVGGKANCNLLRALEEQSRRGLASEIRKVSGSFYTHNAMEMMAKQAVAQKVQKTRSARVFKALLHLGGQVMSEAANTLPSRPRSPSTRRLSRRTAPPLRAPAASRTTRPMTSTAR